ncbi:MAG: carboxymuconolactone decarboxylase family protein [Planctomycetes bacterium]|nr:carboxymuconolactone decarboxylase family protein [Planctomycetota bacterium]
MSECCNGHGPAAGDAGVGDAVGEVQAKFQEFLRAVNQPGALDAHTKQANAQALAVLARCDPCVRAHIRKAREKGFSAAEIDEAAWMAISFGGGPVMMFYNAIRKEAL